jgi:adenine deaminase
MIAPGYRADFCICQGLNQFPPLAVYSRGIKVAEQGKALVQATSTKLPAELSQRSPIASRQRLEPHQFQLDLAASVTVNVITTNDMTTYTELEQRSIEVVEGVPQDDDLLLATVIARSQLAAGLDQPLKISLIAGLKLHTGAFASSFSHDSHNLLVVGKTPTAMAQAANAVIEAKGGMAVVADDIHLLPLTIAGLLSDEPIAMVAEAFADLEESLHQLGMRHKNPILLLSILPLTVSPKYKISDKGLVDVDRREIIELLV